MRGGMILKHFSSRDIVSRWDVLEVHHRATPLAAAHFLDTLLDRVPFPIKALQVDGGSEFAAEFEEACQQKELPLFVLPPRSPRPNGHVEPSNRTHNEEFYQVHAQSNLLSVLNRQLQRWEKIYNCVRPHQSLGYLTPLQSFISALSTSIGRWNATRPTLIDPLQYRRGLLNRLVHTDLLATVGLSDSHWRSRFTRSVKRRSPRGGSSRPVACCSSRSWMMRSCVRASISNVEWP